jgi:hypothetical protein
MATKHDIEPSSISDEHYSAIGKIVANWAALEATINFAIWRIGEIPETIGACITSQIFTFDAKMKALISILEVRGNLDKTITKINKFHDDIRAISTFRNRIAHDPWVHDEKTDSPHRLQISADKTLILEYKLESTVMINNEVQKLNEFIVRFQTIIEPALAKFQPLPEKQR